MSLVLSATVLAMPQGGAKDNVALPDEVVISVEQPQADVTVVMDLACIDMIPYTIVASRAIRSVVGKRMDRPPSQGSATMHDPTTVFYGVPVRSYTSAKGCW